MSFIDDLMGGSDKRKVDEKELDKIERSKLSGLTREQRSDVDKVLRPHIDAHSKNPREKGIQGEEIDEAVKYMREHKKDMHYMDDKKIDQVEKALKDKL
jgi:hypothetical protein